MRRKLLAAGAASAALAVSAGTLVAQADEGRPAQQSPAVHDFTAGEAVADGLTIPWGLAFLPDGSALSAQRDSGDVLLLEPGAEPEVVGNIPVVADTAPFDERGLLGLAVSPDYQDDGYVYAYYSTEEDNRVARFTLDDMTPEPVVTGIPTALNHNGGRLEFGPDGRLYIATGDADEPDNAQDPQSLAGKILRAEPDGSAPEDNPFDDSLVYTWGNRNIQGLAWHASGDLYFSELGQDTWDELNLAEPGANYGWPVVEGDGGGEDYVDPLATWTTAEASPSGAEVSGDVVYVAALRGERLWTVPILDDGVGEPVAALEGELGRIRTVEQAPDGWLWVSTSNGDAEDTVMRYPPLEAD